MADKEISDLTVAATADGTELLHVKQGANSRKITLANVMANLKAVLLETNGDLVIDTDTLFVDVSTGRVGVGTAVPEEVLHVTGNILIPNANSIKIDNAAGTAKRIMRVTASDEFTIEGAGGTNALQIDSEAGTELLALTDTGRLGLGKQIPAGKFHIKTTEDINMLRLDPEHATYTSNTTRILVSRAGSSAFNFGLWTSNNSVSNDDEFRFSGDGNGTCDGSWTGGGADYAEYFEWADGNLAAEDRRGVSVVLDGDKIREATTGETPIGVISGNPSVIGDAASFRWKGKYLRDDHGTEIVENYEIISWTEIVIETTTEIVQATEIQTHDEKIVEIINGQAKRKIVAKTSNVPLFDEYPLIDDEGTDLGIHHEPRMIEIEQKIIKEVEHSYAVDAVPNEVTIPSNAVRTIQQRRELSSSHDQSLEYVPRSNRKEWDTVGLMGKLRLNKGQVVDPRWIKMRDVSTSVEEWLVR